MKGEADEAEKFARHIIETTLTPELRKRWYKDMLDPNSDKPAFKAYSLNIIKDPPPDVAPAMVAALKAQVDNPMPDSREQAEMLGFLVGFLCNHHSPGAGEALLKLATSRYESSNKATNETIGGGRLSAISALKFYWREDMADKIAPLLKSEHKWVPIYAAKLLAWAGDDRGANQLIAAAKDKNPYAVAGLFYLSNSAAAAKTLQEALASEDPKLVAEIRQAIAEQSKLTVQDTKSRITVTVQPDGKTLVATSAEGKELWKVDVVAAAGASTIEQPVVRHLSLDKGSVQAVYGKHSFANFNLHTGAMLSAGSD
jgi:hypothetical protein